MDIESLFKLGVEIGMNNDPRGKEIVGAELEMARDKFDGLKDDEKEFFDQVSFWNPYPDSRIQWHGDKGAQFKHLMVGIDIGTAELLLADRLKERGEKIDAVLSHHPGGLGTIGLPTVMGMKIDIMANLGVPINIAEGISIPRQKEVDQILFSANHYQTADAARLLGIPLFSLHTPADNCVVTFLTKAIAESKPRTIKDLVKLLQDIPEYKEAKRRGLPVKIESGTPDKRCGKVIVSMTGGTTGSKDDYEAYRNAGVGTIVVMHIPKEHVEMAQKNHISIVNMGHMASDSLGMNIILDEFEKKRVSVTPMSGLIRVKRL